MTGRMRGRRREEACNGTLRTSIEAIPVFLSSNSRSYCVSLGNYSTKITQ